MKKKFNDSVIAVVYKVIKTETSFRAHSDWFSYSSCWNSVGCGKISKSKSSTLCSLFIRRENTIIKGFHGTAAYKEIVFERRKQRRRRRTLSKSMLVLLAKCRSCIASLTGVTKTTHPSPTYQHPCTHSFDSLCNFLLFRLK